MADRGGQDLLTKLGDKGEETLGKIVHRAPGGDRVAEMVHAVREQVDFLQRRFRGIDKLEVAVAKLEKRVAELEGKAPAKPAAKRTTTKRAPAKRAPAKPKPPAATPPAA